MRDRLARLVRDPLLHFVVAGLAVFALHRALAPAPATPPRVIVIERAYLDALTEEHARRVGRSVEDADRARTRAAFLREEALVREARALGLDEGDAIVRRRLVQKLELLVRASLSVEAPDDAALAAFLEAHAEAYTAPADVSFELRFFSRERRGERALEDAQTALAAPDGPGAGGDPFPLGARFSHRTLASIAQTLGPELVEPLREGPLDTWSAPIETRHGVHLVRATERRDARPRALDEVRDELRAQVIEQREAEALARALDDIVASYTIEDAP